MATWLGSLHALAALEFAALFVLVAGANSVRSRAGLFALGVAAFCLWSVNLAHVSLRAYGLYEYPWFEPLQMIGWASLFGVLVVATSSRASTIAVRSIGVGVVAAAAIAILSRSGGDVPLRAAAFAISTMGLWIVLELSVDVTALRQAAWYRFAGCAFVLLGTTAILAAVPGTSAAVRDALLIARGGAALSLAPLLGMLVVRVNDLEMRAFVSRDALTTAVVGAVALVAVLLPAFLIYRLTSGASAGPRGLFAALAILLLLPAVLLYSREHATWVRVLLTKHFYRFRYDYRSEWLRLTNTLASSSEDLPKRAIKALADIVASRAGALFVFEPGSESYVAAASWNTASYAPLQEYPPDDLLAFMAESAWIVDSVEYKVRPASQAPSFLDDVLSRTDKELLVVPLLVHDKLFGFVILERPAGLERLTFEDIDILRTGGREVAGHLSQHYLTQRLAEAKQFEEFGRMTAFLVHDLSNISTQQSLILQNEGRHRNNPEFIADAMRTISRSVERINRLVALVRSGSRPSAPTSGEAASVVADAVRLCAGYSPAPAVELPTEPLRIFAEMDQLSHGLAHLVRNSQQAATAAGAVKVALRREDQCALITVSDNGSGMSADFVQERLFRPFDTTKGGTGLGIGAFQIREIVRRCGGSLNVQTVEGVGSVFSIRIPLYEERALSTSVAGG